MKKADVILYDSLIPLEILKKARPDCELIYAGKRAWAVDERQEHINRLMVEKAREGKMVLRLKGGDPSFFARLSEELHALYENHVPFEVVPGVTSPSAAGCACGVSLTSRYASSSVAFITGHEAWWKGEKSVDISKLAKSAHTLVFFMPVRMVERIASDLVKGGLPEDTPCLMVHRAYTPRQKTVYSTLGKVAQDVKSAGLKPPAVLIVGKTCEDFLTFNWFEKRPLFGIGVVNTRAEHQAEKLTSLLRERGAYVYEFPVIKIEPLLKTDDAEKVAGKITESDFVVFTSANGVELTMEVLGANYDGRIFAGKKIACIGSATASALKKYFLKPDVIPEKFVAESLIESMRNFQLKGKRVLILRAEKAREILPEALRDMGALVEVLPIYQTLTAQKSPEEKEELISLVNNGVLHAITFTSSSTVEKFFEIFGDEKARSILSRLKTAVIGPVTADTLREKGIEPEIFSVESTMEHLVKSIESFFSGD